MCSGMLITILFVVVASVCGRLSVSAGSVAHPSGQRLAGRPLVLRTTRQAAQVALTGNTQLQPDYQLALPSQNTRDAALTSQNSIVVALGALGRSVTDSSKPRGGTACRCICGDRTVWERAIFAGDVVKKKQLQCEQEICPTISIPGLMVHSECNYVEDLAELTGGTLCRCQCGDRSVWRNWGFYGNVTKEKEVECLEEVCPRVNPLPGIQFTAKCYFNPQLFSNKQQMGAANRRVYPAPYPGPKIKSMAAQLPLTHTGLMVVIALCVYPFTSII